MYQMLQAEYYSNLLFNFVALALHRLKFLDDLLLARYLLLTR